MKNLYLTSTFTNNWNRDFNPRIGQALEDKEISCYLPHRDTDQNGSNVEIFKQDIDGILNSKIILAIALNESPNWGAEIGFAHALKKPVLALTDNDHPIPIICKGMITEEIRVQDLNNIEEYIDSLVEKIKNLQ